MNATGVLKDPDVQNCLLFIGITDKAYVSQDNLDFAKFDFSNLRQISNLNANGFAILIKVSIITWAV